MYSLPEKKVKRSTGLKQVLPRCSHSDCTTGSGWSGVLHHHASGVRLNEEEWFCGPGCMEEALEFRLRGGFAHDDHPAPIRTAMPMGLMMLSRGAISDLQLRAALDLQRNTGDRIGVCLMRLGCISTGDIASVVATQWGCPVFPAESVQPACSMLLPVSLVERYRMLPVHLVALGRRLFVGFCEKVNHSALMAIEQMLRCKTEACVIPEPKFEEVLDFRKFDTTGEVALARPDSAAEAARIIRNYVQQTGAEAVRMHTVEGNIWTRLSFRSSHLDLVFEHPPT
jgi:hypothetical protein